jgi:hypothetical protein
MALTPENHEILLPQLFSGLQLRYIYAYGYKTHTFNMSNIGKTFF